MTYVHVDPHPIDVQAVFGTVEGGEELIPITAIIVRWRYWHYERYKPCGLRIKPIRINGYT